MTRRVPRKPRDGAPAAAMPAPEPEPVIRQAILLEAREQGTGRQFVVNVKLPGGSHIAESFAEQGLDPALDSLPGFSAGSVFGDAGMYRQAPELTSHGLEPA